MRLILADLKSLLIYVFLSLLLILTDHLGALNYPKSLLQQVTIPVQYGLYQSGLYFKGQFDFIFALRKAAQENKALKKQLSEILLENATLAEKVREKQILDAQYNKIDPKNFDLLPARIIFSGRFLTLDKGLDNGVKVGQAVILYDNLVGEVKEVTPKTAKILLPHDSDFKITVFAQGKFGKAKGILYGQFNSEMLMSKILHEEPLEPGDLVYSEGIEERVPKGLILGRVFEVIEKQNEVFKEAKIESLFDVSELEIVFIIRNP